MTWLIEFGNVHTARSMPVLMRFVTLPDGGSSWEPFDPATPDWIDSTVPTDTERVLWNWRTNEWRREPFDAPPKEPAQDPPGG
jgi:hypothetical protein